MKGHEGVWFARGSEVAELVLNQGATARKPTLMQAVAS
jgi:hypothetical protein